MQEGKGRWPALSEYLAAWREAGAKERDGDPGAVVCRWCRNRNGEVGGRRRQGGGLVCDVCDMTGP